MTTLDLLVIVYGSCSRDPNTDERYGSEQRRVEITLNPIIPANATTIAKKHQWLSGFLLNIGKDMKHNRNWRCEFCKKHARETVWMMCSWMHLEQPKVNCYVHSVCNAASGPCAEEIRDANEQMSRMTGFPATNLPREVKKKGQPEYPMSASCAVCHNDAEESRKSLQCAKCELTRYLSSANGATGAGTKSAARP
ncbi:hypothetical protein C8R43DRAFT_515047 [Mycena crocata]|nr:hypothetical protein C8R43DRAFT_515047 [Mycena crocata]